MQPSTGTLHKDKNLMSAVENRVLQPQEKFVGTPKPSWQLWDQEDKAIFPSHAGCLQGAQPDTPKQSQQQLRLKGI